QRFGGEWPHSSCFFFRPASQTTRLVGIKGHSCNADLFEITYRVRVDVTRVVNGESSSRATRGGHCTSEWHTANTHKSHTRTNAASVPRRDLRPHKSQRGKALLECRSIQRGDRSDTSLKYRFRTRSKISDL